MEKTRTIIERIQVLDSNSMYCSKDCPFILLNDGKCKKYRMFYDTYQDLYKDGASNFVRCVQCAHDFGV